MKELNMKAETTTREEYTVFIKDKERGKYIRTAHPCTADTLEKVKQNYPDYRKAWERCSSALDFNDYEIRHRTITITDWGVVG